MEYMISDRLQPDRRQLRLQTLVRLRWIAVTGQTVAVLFVFFGLGFPLPLAPCLVLIALSAALNVYLWFSFAARVRLDPDHATLLLGYDIVQLVGLLYLTGGLENPFSILLLVPVMVSATSLPLRPTLALSTLVVLSASVLVFAHLPLPWFPDEPYGLPLLYVSGVYIALVCCLGFMVIHARRIAEEARQMSDALATTEVVLAREKELSALDGLAAAAAHELGTPLGTISIVAKELLRATKPDDPAAEDIELLKTQADRCRDILSKLTSLSKAPDAHFARMPLSAMIEEVVAPHREFGVDIRVVVKRETEGAGTAEPIGQRNPAVLHGLGNLVENAVDFARHEVEVTAEWTKDTVRLVIADDGPGFAADVIGQLGEPYVTTRGASRPNRQEGDFGLGLGFFIAKTLLERFDATVELANRPPPRTGAVVSVSWPRAAMDVDFGARTVNN
jgi:two-component system sensor histidine kinase RegB